MTVRHGGSAVHPLWSCGFRPFFVLTSTGAVVFLSVWLLFLNSAALSGWRPPGGVLLWHAHELVFGFGLAAAAGFLLTAIPEFTGVAPIAVRPLAGLVALWLMARAAYALAQWLPFEMGLGLAALCNVSFTAVLLIQLAPALWRDPRRAHLGFAWALAGLLLVQTGFFVALFAEYDGLPWIHGAIDLTMILILLAGSRVSMSVLNGYIEAGRPGEPPPSDRYLARPPRRYLAVFAICTCGVAQVVLGDGLVVGWTALAACAAVLNVLNDWHVGRALFTRWALMLYACFWLIALGYGAMGLAWLAGGWSVSSGRHLLTAGAMGLSVFTIMSLAGRIHTGRWLDRRPWLPVAAGILILAALMRAVAGLPVLAPWAWQLILMAGVLWVGAYAAYLWHAWPVLAGRRLDGREGCAEPAGKAHSPFSGPESGC
ncbi:NnrS family protein [Castellaniella sp.]|uniref:NnrS family protein n=1 Tax=Castellaniella sp. TaxID=1955812 RepID=UPI002AFE7261|nr:NnrS family protein [Castellaniella sp.]